MFSVGVADKSADYVPFALEDYVDSPIALARIKAKVTQKELAKRLGVTQAYIRPISARSSIRLK